MKRYIHAETRKDHTGNQRSKQSQYGKQDIKIAYAAKEFLNIDEVAAYLQVSKGYVYKLTMQKELTVYKPNGKNIFILRDDLNRWIKRNPCFSNAEIERQANVIAYTLGQKSKDKPTKGGKK